MYVIVCVCSTGYEDQYRKTLCIGMNDDDVTPQIEANGMRDYIHTIT